MIEQFMEKVAMEKVAIRRAGKEALKVINDSDKLYAAGEKYNDLSYETAERFFRASRKARNKANKLMGFDGLSKSPVSTETLKKRLTGRDNAGFTGPRTENLNNHKLDYGEPLTVSPERAERRERMEELIANQKRVNEFRNEDPELFDLLKKYSK